MVNSLTRKAGLKLGPIILETLVKHYFERIAKDHESQESTRLRREELLYDEAFNIIRVRLGHLLGMRAILECALDACERGRASRTRAQIREETDYVTLVLHGSRDKVGAPPLRLLPLTHTRLGTQ